MFTNIKMIILSKYRCSTVNELIFSIFIRVLKCLDKFDTDIDETERFPAPSVVLPASPCWEVGTDGLRQFPKYKSTIRVN